MPDTLPGNSYESSNTSGRNTKHVTSACIPCRKAKAKCIGSYPCPRCLDKLLKCEYPAAVDGRSQRGDLKRKVEQLEQESSVLKEIIGYIRSTSEEDASQLIALIRSDASISEVHQCIQQHSQEDSLQEREQYLAVDDLSPQIDDTTRRQDLLSSVQHEDSQSRQRKVFDVARLVDDPPWKVPARPWTQIIDDDGLVSHLVSLWLCWKSPHDTIADRKFVRDMQSGNLASKYCSRSLVSCILAFGCFFSDFAETKTQNGRVSILGNRLINEATQLLQEECNNASILTAQGLSMLCNLAVMAGEKAIAYSILSRTTELYEHMSSRLTRDRAHITEDELTHQTSLNITCWSLANWLTTSFFVLMEPSKMSLPSTPLIPIIANTTLFDSFWYCYPRDLDPVSSYASEIFDKMASLQIIVHGLSQTLFDTLATGPQYVARALQALEKLNDWHSGLPDHLRFSKTSIPSVLTMDAWYYGILLKTHNGLQMAYEANAELAGKHVEANGVDAALCVVDICRVHQSNWGIERLNMVLAHVIVYALRSLVAESPLHRYDDEITDLCVYLRKAGRRIPAVTALLHEFRLDIQNQGKRLPIKTQHLFQNFETND